MVCICVVVLCVMCYVLCCVLCVVWTLFRSAKFSGPEVAAPVGVAELEEEKHENEAEKEDAERVREMLVFLILLNIWRLDPSNVTECTLFSSITRSFSSAFSFF